MKLGHWLDGDPAAPPLVLSGSLGTTLAMWEPQLPALTQHFLVLRFDHTGHGSSPVPDGPVTIDELGSSLVRLLDDLGLQRVSFCGLSLGGSVGMWLASRAAERVERLVLCCTAARYPPADQWSARAELVRREGLAAVADGVLERWLTPRFRATQPATVEHYRAMLLSIPAEGYARCCEVVRDLDLRDDLDAVAAPTLVLAGADDPAVTPDDLRVLTDGLPDVRLTKVRDAAHLANVEQPDAVTRALLGHLGADRGEEAA